jgi:hypothetical protein
MQFATVIHHLRREIPEAKAAAATNIGRSTEQANVFMLGCGMVEEGWAMAHEGQHARGLARIGQGIDVCRNSDAILEFPHCWTAFVDTYRVAGRIDEALRAFGARRISVATPYPDWNNEKLRAYLEAHGFWVLNVEGEPRAAASGNQGINDQDPESVVEFASRACRPEADALLCSCTAWRSVEAAAAIEARVGKPVVTSNQSTIWASLRVLAVTQPVTGFGRLLDGLAAAPTAA